MFTLLCSILQGKGTKSRGQLVLHASEKQRIFDFLDYVYGGTQLNCSFAIDFTGITDF
jgi:hypothetical protein